MSILPQLPPAGHSSIKRRATSNIRKLEAKGLLIISILMLLYAIIRYWHDIPWGAR